jgi:GAF domain-containing protein
MPAPSGVFLHKATMSVIWPFLPHRWTCAEERLPSDVSAQAASAAGSSAAYTTRSEVTARVRQT